MRVEGRLVRRLVLGLLAAAVIAASASAPAGAATPSAKKVERTAEALFHKYPLRAEIFGVWVKGRLVAKGAFGEASPGVPATTKDHFRTGNVLESMTVTLLLQFVEEGKVTLDTPISTWFPNVPRASEVTVDMLARSTSGYAHYGADEDFARQVNKDPHRRWKVSEVLEVAFGLPPLFDPGADFAFSDTNFLLLGKVLRRIGGKPVDQLLRERLWSRLGMKETRMRTDARITAPVLHGFTSQRGRYEDATSWSPSTFRRAANATGTLSDVGRWVNALGTGALLPPELHALQIGDRNVGFTGQTEEFHYAMGSGINNGWIYNNPRLFGYKGLATHLPSKGVSVVVFTTDGPKGDFNEHYNHAIGNRIAKLFAPKQALKLPFP